MNTGFIFTDTELVVKKSLDNKTQVLKVVH